MIPSVQAQLYVHMNGVHGLAGWQWLFIISGAITVLLGLIGLLIVPDSPSNTRAIWLTATDKRISRERMERHDIQPARLIPWRVLRAKMVLLLRHPLTWMFLAVFAQNAWAGRANSYILLYLKGMKDKATDRPLYSTYQVNLIPLGGYALQIITNVGINALGDYKGWRWQICVASGLVQIVACAILASWPARHAVIMFAYFLTYTTSASGPSIVAWLAELLRTEPESRSIIVGMTVTVVYVGHATIPLGVWKVTDSPQFPIGFPLAAAFATSAILVVLGIRFWFVRKCPEFTRLGYEAGNEPCGMNRIAKQASSRG